MLTQNIFPSTGSNCSPVLILICLVMFGKFPDTEEQHWDSFKKTHALVTCFRQRHKIHLLVGRHSLSYLLHWRQISFCTIFLLTENAGLFKRQEGRGLFPESGWSHAVMQVTGMTRCFFTCEEFNVTFNVNPECNRSTHVFRNIRLQWLFALFQCSGS